MEFEPITTQEQLEVVVQERIKQERAKFEGYEDYKKKAEEYDKLEKTSKDYEQTIISLNKAIDGDEKNAGYKKQIEDLQKKVKGGEISLAKIRIANEKGIPLELAGRLNGDDEEAIRKDAESVAKYLAGSNVPPLASTETEVNGKKAAMRNMLAGLKGE